MKDYQLSCESTVDLPFSYVDSRAIKVLFYSYFVDGESYPDDMDRDPEALPKFYDFIAKGKIPSTSQLNEFQYEEFFRGILKTGKNILHLAFGTGMTQSYGNAVLAAKTLKGEFPNQKIIVIDTTCSSSGYGLLLDDVADMRDEGKEVDEIVDWVESNKTHIHHQFYSTDLKYFRRTGRMSGPTSMVATIMHVCPIMHLNKAGRIIAYDKAVGRKAAIKKTIDTMEAHCDNGKDYSGKIFISHSNSLADAVKTKDLLAERFPKAKEIRLNNIGTIIASHAGPGTVAIYFHGDERIE